MKFLTNSLPLLFSISLTWILRLFIFFQLNPYLFFLAQYLSCKLLFPKILLLHFCFILKSVTLTTSGFLCYKFIPLNFVIVLAEPFLYSKINSVPRTFSIPSTQSMKLSITDFYFSPNLCKCTSSLWRSHLYTIWALSFLPPFLWPKQVYSKHYPKDFFVCVSILSLRVPLQHFH